jgi:hypothetical protein
MANVSNLAALKILKAMPLRIYINPTFASDGSIVLTGGGLDTTGHPTAKDLGYTQGGLQFGSAPTYEGVPVDQTPEDILMSLSSKVNSIKFKGLQVRDYAIWQKIIPATALLTATGLTGISDSTDQTVTPFSLVAIAPTPNDPTKFVYICGYSGYNIAPFNVNFGKQYNVTDIEMKLIDPGRADGKTWAIWESTA